MEIYNKNWYKTAKVLDQLNKEAGLGKNTMTLIYAAALFLMGWSVINISNKTKLSESEVQQAISNTDTINKAKQAMQDGDLEEMQKNIEFYSTIENTMHMEKQLANMDGNNKQQKAPNTNKQPSVNNSGDYLGVAANLIRHHEGARKKVYKDSKGIPTIGIGFNLKQPSAKHILQELGIDYKKTLQGKYILTDAQIESLFKITFEKAHNDARRIVPNFDSHPSEVKAILVDMCFNLGDEGFSKFENFIKALSTKDYYKAAYEMVDSDWYKQVGNRAKTLVNMMKNVAASERA